MSSCTFSFRSYFLLIYLSSLLYLNVYFFHHPFIFSFKFIYISLYLSSFCCSFNTLYRPFIFFSSFSVFLYSFLSYLLIISYSVYLYNLHLVTNVTTIDIFSILEGLAKPIALLFLRSIDKLIYNCTVQRYIKWSVNQISRK